MTKAKQAKKDQESDNLNELLEDALDELLLNDDTDVEIQGKPNIEESLKKITEVNRAQKPIQDKSGDSDIASKSGAIKKQQQQAGSSKSSSSSIPPPSSKMIDEEEMNRFFAEMTEKLKEMPKIDPNEAQARISESVPQIFDLMQNLLSKELLYPALKDLAPKFDDWLQKNLATLSKEDRRRYKRQIKKIHEIIDVFDDETMDNQERFEKNLDLMEQMQALGAPPEELTVPEGMNKCSIM